MNRIAHCFFDVPMVNQHDGLTRIAKKEAGIDTAELSKGEMLLFLNRANDKIKVLSSIGKGPRNIVLAYWRGKPGQAIDRLAIQYIAQAFNGTAINYTDALKRAMEKRFSHD